STKTRLLMPLGVFVSLGTLALCIAQLNAAANEQREVDEALRIAQSRLQRAISAGKVGLWNWRPDSTDVEHSPEWRSSLGFSSDMAATLDTWIERIHPDQREQVRAALESAAK